MINIKIMYNNDRLIRQICSIIETFKAKNNGKEVCTATYGYKQCPIA